MNTTKPLREWAAALLIARSVNRRNLPTFGAQRDRLQAKGGKSPIYTRDASCYRPITGPYRRRRLRRFLRRRLEDLAIVALAVALMAAIALLTR